MSGIIPVRFHRLWLLEGAEHRLSASAAVVSPLRFPFPGPIQLLAYFLDLFFKLVLSRNRHQLLMLHDICIYHGIRTLICITKYSHCGEYKKRNTLILVA